MRTSRAFPGLYPIPVHSSPDTINDGYDVPAGCILWLAPKDVIDRHSVSADKLEWDCRHVPQGAEPNLVRGLGRSPAPRASVHTDKKDPQE